MFIYWFKALSLVSKVFTKLEPVCVNGRAVYCWNSIAEVRRTLNAILTFSDFLERLLTCLRMVRRTAARVEAASEAAEGTVAAAMVVETIGMETEVSR
jgi:hypothetical protein